MNKPMKIGLISLGCPKNEADAEVMLHRVNQAGWTIEEDPKLCDVIIINTCGFIESAKKEAINTILEIADLKKEGMLKKLIISGCFSSRYKDEVFNDMPEIDVVLGVSQYPDIVEHIKRAFGEQRYAQTFLDESFAGANGRILVTPPYRAYLKIAEGCSNRCSYCAIPGIRGKLRSRTPNDIIDEARVLIDSGIKEITLVAQDTTRYGLDMNTNFKTLLSDVAKLDKNVWIRTLYMYPEMVDDELIDIFGKYDNICSYMDIPLQHSDDTILRAMNRHSTRAGIEKMYKKIRNNLDGVALRTTFITGFPNETQENFNNLASFIKEYPFDHVGVFSFSPEDGTKAFDMDNQIDSEIAVQRRDLLLQYQSEISSSLLKKRIGKSYQVLVEDDQEGSYWGRSQHFTAEIDGEIEIKTSKKLKIGDFYNVKIESSTDYDLIGSIVE